MKKQITIKHKKRKRIIRVIIVILIMNIIFNFITKALTPKIIHYAELEIRKLSGIIITDSVKTEDLEKIDINNIYIITRNNKNEILTVDINTLALNTIVKESTKNIQENLKKLEQGKINTYNDENENGVVLKVPLGQIYNSFILDNIGPNIPVKLKILGDIQSKTDTKIKNYGINNALLEITLEIKIKEEVILPITTKEIEVTQTIPLAIKMITGTVPNYYSNGINKTETFSIPIE